MPSRRDSDGESTLMLTKDNLSMWVLDIRARLRKKELWDCTRDNFKPSIVLNDTSTSEEKAQVQAEKTEWSKKAMKAADEMTPRISLEVKQMLDSSHFDNGYLMLGRVYQLLQPVGDAQFMRLTKEFYSLRMLDFKDMTEFLTHLKTLMEKITATKVPFTVDKQMIIGMMMAMDSRYDTVGQMWSMLPNLNAEQARNMLMEEERRQGNTEISTSLRVTTAKKEKCSHCGKGSHKICWDKEPDKAPAWYKLKLEEEKNSSGSGGGGSSTSRVAFSF